jgi:proline iminopeptidase
VRRALTLVAIFPGAVAAGVVATLAVAWLAAAPVLFLGAGWATALAAWLLAGRALRPGSRRWQVWGAVGVSAVLATALVPLGDPVRLPAMPPGSGRWTLPDGGSLAYGMVHADAGVAAATPVVVLHGGPGVPDLAGFLHALAPLAAAGHDVWAYDQRGAGRSSRLADPRGYTTRLAVDDLEQVRSRIGARRLILVGHSYGAFLAAAYLAAHPDRVEKVIFSSPGDLDRAGVGGAPQSRLDPGHRLRLYALLSPPRALLTYALVQVNPAAAHALAGDREVDARQDRVFAASRPALHCPGRSGTLLHGLGFYANQVPQSLRRPATPDLGRALRGTRVPALIIKGQCDYLNWQTATRYLDTFSDGRLSYLPGSGHDCYLDRPELYLAAVSAFLAGKTVPGTLRDPYRPPRDYQP